MARASIKSKTSARDRKIAASRKAVIKARATVLAAARRSSSRFAGIDELKFVDVTLNATSTAAGGTTTLMNGVSQGDDYNNRQGRKVNWTSLYFRGHVAPNSGTNAPEGDVLRVMLVWDNQPNGALAAVTDVLSTANVTSPRNLNNRERFVVLSDQTYVVGANAYTAGALTTGSPSPTYFSIYKKLQSSTIFGGTGSAITDINTGSLFLLRVGKTANASLLSHTLRLRFADP